MAAQDISANLHYPMAENYSVDKFQLTIEKFEGTVHEIMQKTAILDGVYRHIPLIGTDTMSNSEMGQPTLQSVTAGVEPLGKDVELGKMIVQVKTPIIARVTTAMLADVQTHIDVRSKTPGNFGKRLAKHTDELKFVQIVKSALYDSATGSGGSGNILPKGSKTALGSAGDDILAAELTAAIYSITEKLALLDIDVNEGMLYMSPVQYFTLLKNKDLLDSDINKPNGSYAHAKVHAAAGMPIVMTNRITQVVDTVAVPSKTDSTAALYGAAYETSVAEAKARALYATSDSIMVAESIPLTSDVYWEKRLLSWFIDAYMAIGAAPDRTDVNGIVLAA
jgi:hypothetical protein